MSDPKNAPAEQAVIRNPDGTFPRGVSGNPSGRPKGSVNARARFRNHIEANLDRLYEVFDAHLERCKEGDPAALKLLYDTLDGLLAVKIEGLSEEEIRARLVRVMQELRARLPEEWHQAITDAARAAMLEEGEG
jgi:hypothetical protein